MTDYRVSALNRFVDNSARQYVNNPADPLNDRSLFIEMLVSMYKSVMRGCTTDMETDLHFLVERYDKAVANTLGRAFVAAAAPAPVPQGVQVDELDDDGDLVMSRDLVVGTSGTHPSASPPGGASARASLSSSDLDATIDSGSRSAHGSVSGSWHTDRWASPRIPRPSMHRPSATASSPEQERNRLLRQQLRQAQQARSAASPPGGSAPEAKAELSPLEEENLRLQEEIRQLHADREHEKKAMMSAKLVSKMTKRLKDRVRDIHVSFNRAKYRCEELRREMSKNSIGVFGDTSMQSILQRVAENDLDLGGASLDAFKAVMTRSYTGFFRVMTDLEKLHVRRTKVMHEIGVETVDEFVQIATIC